MSQTKQILLAFLIPFILAVSLTFLTNFLFVPQCPSETEVCFIISDESLSFTEVIYKFLIIGLFLTSLILPPFITKRAYQNKRNKLEMKSIIE
jgi:hypothetical protein